jgi:alpha-N-arabinofuranosidase
VLRVEPTSPNHTTAKHGDVPLLHATAVQNEDGTTTVFAVNRDTANPLELSVDVRSLAGSSTTALTVIEHRVIADDDRHAHNTRDAPDRVRPRQIQGARVDQGLLTASLPPLSWNVIRLNHH